MSELRRTPFYRALHRPNLFLGGERELVMSTAVLCFSLAVSSQTLPAIIACSAIWLISLFFFRWMAKIDPMLFRVYMRHLNYKDYYPPRATPWRED